MIKFWRKYFATFFVLLANVNNSVYTLETELRGGTKNQTQELPTWFDPRTMRVVEKDDTMYLGYVLQALLLSRAPYSEHSQYCGS